MCGLFDVVIVDVWVDPRHENALALDVRTVHCACDLAAACDGVDAKPCEQKASENAEYEAPHAGG